MKKTLQISVAGCLLALSLGAQAQGQAQNGAKKSATGLVISVIGLVTLSDENEIRDAAVDAKLRHKVRVVTGADSRVTLRLNDCCEVTIEENESLVIDDGLACGVLWAHISPTGQAAAAATIPGAPVAAGAGILAGLLQNRPVSRR